MFTLTYDKTGTIIAKSQYSEHQSTLSSDQIECTQEQFLNCQNYQIVDGKIVQIASDIILSTLKADLCEKIDIEAMRVGDLQVKSSIYLSEEYRLNSADAIEWKKTGYSGEPPNSIKQGALSHGISDKEECDLILVAAANSDALIAELRFWRMSTKGVNGINGAKNAEEAQKIHDEAITCLNNRINDILGK